MARLVLRIFKLALVAVAVATIAASLVAVPSAHAAQRTALIIGNESYAELPSLEKAIADSLGYAQLFEEKGFDQVIHRTNLTRSGMDLAIANFLDAIEPGDTAVFVYAGHGWSDGNINYLVGVDAPKSSTQSILARISIPLQNGANGVIDEMSRRGATLKIAIVDACRDNPFQSDTKGRAIGISRGLAQADPPRGTFVIFSAGAKQIALDRLSNEDPYPQSVFTRTFLPLLHADLPLLDAIKTAQVEVYKLARLVSHEQEPAYYDQVRGSVCLSPSCRGDYPLPSQQVPQADFCSSGLARAYEVADEINTIYGWEAFLRGCKDDCIYCLLADAALRKLKDRVDVKVGSVSTLDDLIGQEDRLWRDVLSARDALELETALEGYIGTFPEGSYADEANQRLAALHQAKEDRVWQPVLAAADDAALESALDAYVQAYPDGRHVEEARERLAALETARMAHEAEDQLWNDLAATTDERALETALGKYLGTYPDGRHADEAGERLAALQGARAAREEEEDRLWNEVTAAGDERAAEAALARYLGTYPEGRHADMAGERLAALQSARAAREEEEYGAWGRVAEATDESALEVALDAYLRAYPEGRFASQAGERLAALHGARDAREAEARLWEEVSDATDDRTLEAALGEYLGAYPDGRHAREAGERLAALQPALDEARRADEENRLWNAVAGATSSSTLENALADYLRTFPVGEGSHSEQAERRLAALRGDEDGEIPSGEAGEQAGILALQEILRDAGCYRGSIDGLWGRGSQTALEEFLGRTDTDAVAEPSPELLRKIRSVEPRTAVCSGG
ncbi:MAG TPA: caspase family protein [Thermohalobaculum sp.]|nr:caspase family protein [Thermohalobaculum sp.]